MVLYVDFIMNIRLTIIFVAFVLFWILLLVRIFDLSILKQSSFQAQADKNILREEYIVPVRGQILDRNGKPLATNNVGFTLALPRVFLCVLICLCWSKKLRDF